MVLRSIDGRQGRCRPCHTALKRIADGVDPDDAYLMPEPGQYCSICGRIPLTEVVFDHDHKTGRFRGWLCSQCNRALGYFGDDVLRLLNAIDYVTGRRWRLEPFRYDPDAASGPADS